VTPREHFKSGDSWWLIVRVLKVVIRGDSRWEFLKWWLAVTHVEHLKSGDSWWFTRRIFKVVTHVEHLKSGDSWWITVSIFQNLPWGAFWERLVESLIASNECMNVCMTLFFTFFFLSLIYSSESWILFVSIFNLPIPINRKLFVLFWNSESGFTAQSKTVNFVKASKFNFRIKAFTSICLIGLNDQS